VRIQVNWRVMRNVLIVAGICAGMLAIWCGYRAAAHWYTITFGVKRVAVAYDDICQKGLIKKIDEWFVTTHKTGRLRSESREVLTKEIIKTFPVVKRVSWATYLPGQLHCRVTGVRPTFYINKKYVAGNNGKLYKPSDFSVDKGTVPHITISKDWLTTNVFSSVHSFFEKLPKHLYSSYHITYHDPYSIALAPVGNDALPHRCICLVDEQSVPRLCIPNELMQLCQDLKKRSKDKQVNKKICLFDFRFDNRIISKLITQREYSELQRAGG